MAEVDSVNPEAEPASSVNNPGKFTNHKSLCAFKQFGLNFNVGERVEAKDLGNNEWYTAVVVDVDWDDTEVLIHFEESSQRCDEWISMDSSRLRPSQNPVIQNSSKLFEIGERVMATWIDYRKYPAKITKILPNDKYEVQFNDGFIKQKEGRKNIKLPPSPAFKVLPLKKISKTDFQTPGVPSGASFIPANMFDIYDCPHCYNVYHSERTLKYHILKVHQDEANELRNKSYNYQCGECNRHFNVEKNFKYHERKVHGIRSLRKKFLDSQECVLCGGRFTKRDILHHIKVQHEAKIEEKDLQFESFSDFKLWKQHTEKETLSKFIQKQGCSKATDHSTYYFVCHRSGNFFPTGKGGKHLKDEGSYSINGYCPASIRVMKYLNGICAVRFIETHVGHHEIDL